MRWLVLACAGVSLAVAAGCGGSSDQSDGGDDSAASDAAADVVDAGPVPYPAPHTPMPLVDYNGGRVLANMKVVTITFASDNANTVSRIQQFGDTITSTPWWSTSTSEYCVQPAGTPCVGPGTGGGHVVITDPPLANYTDSSQGGASSIHDFIKAHVPNALGADAGADASAADFPVPDENTLYVIYFPASVTVTLDGTQSCSNGGFLGYHNTMLLPDKNASTISVGYAILPRCDNTEATLTHSASHELAEAATDPDIGVNSIAYYMTNQLWAFAGGEVGDVCVDFLGGSDSVVESTFTVQRIWSNKSAKASHDPCVPIPNGEVYFNSAARQDHIILAKAGATATVDIDGYSDAPRADWTVSAFDFASFQGQNAAMSFSFDTTTVNNGTHVTLTVTALTAVPGGQDGLVLISKDSASNTRRTWPVLVTSK